MGPVDTKLEEEALELRGLPGQQVEVTRRSLREAVGAVGLTGPQGQTAEITLQEICDRLESMRERTPRGRTSWQPSSVRMLLERAERIGLL